MDFEFGFALRSTFTAEFPLPLPLEKVDPEGDGTVIVASPFGLKPALERFKTDAEVRFRFERH